MKALLLAVLLVPAVSAQTIQADPAQPHAGDAVSLQTTVLGNVTWDFGDRQTANGRSVSHIFPYAGIFHIRVLQGTAVADEQELVVRIPDELYVKDAARPPPANTTTTNTTAARAPVIRSAGGLFNYLSDNPLVLILVLGGVVGGGLFAVKRFQARKPKAAPEEPAPQAAPVEEPDEETLEDLLPGAEDIEDPAPTAQAPEAAKPAEPPNPLSILPKTTEPPKADRNSFAEKLGD